MNSEGLAACGRVERLRALMAQRGYDAVVLRNNPDLRWLTGAARTFDFELAHTAFVTADGLWLHTDSRYYNTFVERLGTDTAWQLDMDIVDAPAWVASMVAKTRSRVVAIEDTVQLSFYNDLLSALQSASVACLLPQLHGDLIQMRAVKDAAEIAAMRKAQAITDDAFEHMCSYIRPGLTELQLRVELDNYMLSHGADALSFDTIVASGPNTANPHAQPGERVVQIGDFVLMDYGAGLGDYKSDMTRTVVVGQPSEKQRALYDLVRSVNEACEAAVHPGVIGKDIHNLAVRLISEAGYGDYFKHGLGHGVGLEIHEEPRFSRLDEHVMEPGHVVTVEPGVYLPGFGGVRLEDYGVVTSDGFDVFTRASHDLVVIDA
ncbi:MAG: aminopeptidase P family protein [Coriobacteriia bacterium]|nr:aminopeptidase P family protein [Coriobacteriia bacterium]